MRPQEVVHSDPEIMGGEPVFVGTRVPFKTLFEHLEDGATLEEFLRSFPTVGSRAGGRGAGDCSRSGDCICGFWSTSRYQRSSLTNCPATRPLRSVISAGTVSGTGFCFGLPCRISCHCYGWPEPAVSAKSPENRDCCDHCQAEIACRISCPWFPESLPRSIPSRSAKPSKFARA